MEELEGAEVSEVSDNDAEEVSDNEDFSKVSGSQRQRPSERVRKRGGAKRRLRHDSALQNKMIKEKKPKGKGKTGKSK